jgi:hypothetical protein
LHIVGNQERRTADDWLVVQPEDVTDMHYRTVSGDPDELKGQLEEMALPYKELREMRPGEKARRDS